MKIISVLIKTLLLLVLLIALTLGGLLIYGTLTDFQPKEKIDIEQVNKQNTKIASNTKQFSALIWNIGYCGLGAEMDFFYDGGKQVITPLNQFEKYQKGVLNQLKKYADIDFILLQEVDFDAKRSYFNNQRTLISQNALPNTPYTEALNYHVDFIPIPLYTPLGKVKAGLVNYSKYDAIENTRYQFPGNYSWPTRLYMLDRCFLLQRFGLPNTNKELVIINTHNSAYDDGDLKQKQMEYLRNILLAEYGKGNYVVVGGDWNQTPPNYDNTTFKVSDDYVEQVAIANDFLPANWHWTYSNKIPTNRKITNPYDKQTTFKTVIDFYVTSPNVTVNKVENIDLDFQFSDHQPVLLNFSLD